jgi:adenylate cyclase
MVEQGKTRIIIDLNQFKLHISIRDRMKFSLHFNSPSRRFYLSVIALIAHEMKKLGRIAFIPLEEHYETVALFNETIGGQAGSSSREQLLPRVYRKWMDALPDLDHAPLFRVLGRTKEYEDAIGKTYPFTDEERDAWANLFEYKGSHENVRLRFSVDTLGVTLDEVIIVYGDDLELVDAEAWDSFLASLTSEGEEKPERAYRISARPVRAAPALERRKRARSSWWSWPTLAIVIGLVVALASFLVWKSAFYSPQSEVSPLDREGYPLPDKPSIAVLPFVNMSGDPKQEYLSDGITEQIITGLSKVPKLFVIAHHSTFTYKGRATKVQQVSRELGVRYVMEGSVHRSDSRIRVTAQLIDAMTGHHLWAQRYDRGLRDLFALQDEITMKIITALEVALTEGEQALVSGSGTDDLDAYLKILEARELARHQSIEDNHKARRLAEEATVLDPDYAEAYRWLSGTHYMDVWLGSTKSPQESLKKAVELAKKALSLDNSLGSAHGLLGNIYIMRKDYEKGLMEAKRAVELEPNGADSHVFLGMGLRFADRSEEAIPILEKALRLDPYAPAWHLHNLASAYRNVERYEEAAHWAERAVQQNPKNVASRIVLCSIYSLSGRMDKAREQAKQVISLNPAFSLERFAKTAPQKNQVLKKQYMDALRKAGLK